MRVTSKDYDKYHSEIRKGLFGKVNSFTKHAIERQTTKRLEAHGDKRLRHKDSPCELTKTRQYNPIISINLTNSKYHVFHQNGTMINRVDFKAEVEKYGDLISTS